MEVQMLLERRLLFVFLATMLLAGCGAHGLKIPCNFLNKRQGPQEARILVNNTDYYGTLTITRDALFRVYAPPIDHCRADSFVCWYAGIRQSGRINRRGVFKHPGIRWEGDAVVEVYYSRIVTCRDPNDGHLYQKLEAMTVPQAEGSLHIYFPDPSQFSKKRHR